MSFTRESQGYALSQRRLGSTSSQLESRFHYVHSIPIVSLAIPRAVILATFCTITHIQYLTIRHLILAETTRSRLTCLHFFSVSFSRRIGIGNVLPRLGSSNQLLPHSPCTIGSSCQDRSRMAVNVVNGILVELSEQNGLTRGISHASFDFVKTVFECIYMGPYAFLVILRKSLLL